MNQKLCLHFSNKKMDVNIYIAKSTGRYSEYIRGLGGVGGGGGGGGQ